MVSCTKIVLCILCTSLLSLTTGDYLQLLRKDFTVEFLKTDSVQFENTAKKYFADVNSVNYQEALSLFKKADAYNCFSKKDRKPLFKLISFRFSSGKASLRNWYKANVNQYGIAKKETGAKQTLILIDDDNAEIVVVFSYVARNMNFKSTYFDKGWSMGYTP